MGSRRHPELVLVHDVDVGVRQRPAMGPSTGRAPCHAPQCFQRALLCSTAPSRILSVACCEIRPRQVGCRQVTPPASRCLNRFAILSVKRVHGTLHDRLVLHRRCGCRARRRYRLHSYPVTGAGFVCPMSQPGALQSRAAAVPGPPTKPEPGEGSASAAAIELEHGIGYTSTARNGIVLHPNGRDYVSAVGACIGTTTLSCTGLSNAVNAVRQSSTISTTRTGRPFFGGTPRPSPASTSPDR